MFEAVEGMLAEHADLESRLALPETHADARLARTLNRRYAELNGIIGTWREWQQHGEDAEAARELAADDPAFAEEVEELLEQREAAAEKLRRLLVPRDETDDSDAILEVMAGAGGEESALFATSLEEALAPIAAPRYLVSRPVVGDLDPLARLRLGVSGRHAAEAEAWHAVPTALGRRAADAKAFRVAWEHWVGGSGLLYTGSPEGAGVLAAQRGVDPFDVTAVIRRHWS